MVYEIGPRPGTGMNIAILIASRSLYYSIHPHVFGCINVFPGSQSTIGVFCKDATLFCPQFLPGGCPWAAKS